MASLPVLKTSILIPFYLDGKERPQMFNRIPTLEELDKYLEGKGWYRQEGLQILEDGTHVLPVGVERLELYHIKEEK